MTEEEKKAIEDLKEEIKNLEKAKIEFSNEIEDKGWLQKNINELDNDIFYKNTLLNLIEKLQKENEEYKLLNANIEKANKIIEGKEEYIPKDKIRELLENNYDISTENSRSMSYDGAFGFVEDIEELLEEG